MSLSLDALSAPSTVEEALRQVEQLKQELRQTQRELRAERALSSKGLERAMGLHQLGPEEPSDVELVPLDQSRREGKRRHSDRTEVDQGEQLLSIISPNSAVSSRGVGGGGDEADTEQLLPAHAHGLDEYFSQSLWKILAQRLPWLVGLLLLQSFSAFIMNGFEAMLESHFIITMFLPMVVGTAGNAGNQPGVMVTRALCMGDVPIRRLLAREVVVAGFSGTVLAVVCFLRVAVEHPNNLNSALTISLATFVVVVVSVVLGIAFSICIDKLNMDPAAGSAPLLTTISDLVGVVLLCVTALALLGTPSKSS